MPKAAEKVLVSWTAPSRAFKRRSRQFYITVFSIAGLVILILAVMGEFLPILLIMSLVFMYYVMTTVEPGNANYAITADGVKVEGQLTPWSLLGRFWFVTRAESEILVVEVANVLGRLEMVISPEVKEDIKKALSAHLEYEEISPSIVDKSSDWVSSRFSTK